MLAYMCCGAPSSARISCSRCASATSTPSFLVLSLCLTTVNGRPSAVWLISKPFAVRKHLSLFECFPYVCPEPVLVKTIMFSIKMAQKI